MTIAKDIKLISECKKNIYGLNLSNYTINVKELLQM